MLNLHAGIKRCHGNTIQKKLHPLVHLLQKNVCIYFVKNQQL